MYKWYVIHTKARQEKLAKENLSRQGYLCFLPSVQSWQKRRGHRYQTLEPYFPAYLFIWLHLGKNNIAPIRSTIGVIDLVRFGKHIQSIPDSFIGNLQSKANHEGVLDLPLEDYHIGRKVVIENGAFAGCHAIFMAKSGAERAVLLMNFLGRVNELKIPIRSISLSN